MDTHEDFSRTPEPQGGSDRSFGIVFSLAFALLGVWPRWHSRPLRWWALAVSIVLLSIALGRASLLHPVNRVWTRLAGLLQRVTNPIVTAMLFYLVVTPMAALLRMQGKDPLRLRFDPRADSYWLPRQPPGPPPQTMANQF